MEDAVSDGGVIGVDVGGGGGKERILVSVRLRPLNEKEIARNDLCDWECINDTSIIFRNSLRERSGFPIAYTFDRVFGGECNTKQVYEEAAREVALSVVSGINSTIFAYGQTSSGKTYTMTGITEYTVVDIFDYMQAHEERAFVLKFSAIEIYNEAVKDLLSNDNTPLRLLDDPERGTIVEKLTEVTLRDWSHLKELLLICAAQRKIGETLLNETSSRSHQIIKLTIESSAREFLGKGKTSSLVASVNFVDLAGSERASQALSAGSRLKEGCHINRSLLTLGTVIRKLSKGRHGHVPYRDSKLTRILQPSLGGNARTAIICTMCPARSHLEQSRNTLLFASCAKEVVTNARVNVVMSDKALVKHLQKELARLESELRNPGSASGTSHLEALLRGKDAQIKKMEKEIKELIRQRDLAQSQLKNFLRIAVDDRASRQWDESSQVSTSRVTTSEYDDVVSVSATSGFPYRGLNFGFTKFDKSMGTEDWNELHSLRSGKLSENDAFSPSHSISSSNFIRLIPRCSENNTHEAVGTVEDHCKDVQCIEIAESSTSGRKELGISLNERTETQLSTTSNQEYNATRPLSVDSPAITLEQQLQNVRKRIDDLVRPYHDEMSSVSSTVELSKSQSSALTKSRSCRTSMNSVSSPWFQDAGHTDNNTPPNSFLRNFPGRPDQLQRRHVALNCDIESETLLGLKEMAQIQYDKQCGHSQIDNGDVEVGGMRKDAGVNPMLDLPESSPSRWPAEFEKKQQEIIELWHECNVSLVHRACFFLLFRGDPADSFYMEVELRRLSFLKSTSQKNLDKTPSQESLHISQTSSSRKLQREREMLCKQMHKRLSADERRHLYTEWGIALDSKQRKLQVARRLWTETNNIEHIRESASLVAKLIGLLKPEQALREMFGLSFTPQITNRRLFGWKHGLTSLKQ
ncbi:Plus-end-directed kinesin ATPase protein [Dioscorea alata]|nr:Plus-end-directed kinesin ATPase protein [Dioscorea alata]